MLMDDPRREADRLDVLAAQSASLAEGQRLADEANRLRRAALSVVQPLQPAWAIFRN
jgi:hypothetical protein